MSLSTVFKDNSQKKGKNILNSYFPQAPPLHVSQARSVTSRAARPRGQVRTHFAWRRPLPRGAGELFLTTGLFHWLIMTTSAAAPRACVETPLFVNNLSFAEWVRAATTRELVSRARNDRPLHNFAENDKPHQNNVGWFDPELLCWETGY